MATKREPRKKATPRKRPAKRSNSNIAAARKATEAKRAEAEKDQKSDSARRARLTSYAKQNDEKASAGNPGLTDPKVKAAQEAIDPRRPRQPVLEQNTRPDRAADTFKGGPEAAAKIAGLAISMRQQEAANPKPKNPLTDASNYGSNPTKRAQRLSQLSAATADAKAGKLKKAGSAVWMGSKRQTVKLRNTGPERFDENGNDTSTETVSLSDDVRSTDELMSWLTDEKTFNQIRDAAVKAGMDVQSYDDVAKIWEQVVKQAAAAYSTTGKKVTPWALLTLRGKSMVNGKPASKTTTSTSIDEMDPAQAKVMIKNSLQQMLGRDPRQDEIDDFISKAQTIAKQNPNITTTTTQYGFDGEPVSQSSISKGGGDIVSAKAQLAAEEMAESAPDYAQYQAAGVYAPWMFEALSSPI